MDRKQLTAILRIAKKLDWMDKPAAMVAATCLDMVVAQRIDDACEENHLLSESDTMEHISMMAPGNIVALKHEARDLRNAWITRNCI